MSEKKQTDERFEQKAEGVTITNIPPAALAYMEKKRQKERDKKKE